MRVQEESNIVTMAKAIREEEIEDEQSDSEEQNGSKEDQLSLDTN